MSSKPMAVPRRAASPRSCSVAPAARARSLASPVPAAPAANAPRPRAAVPGAPAIPATTGIEARPAMEPSAELNL